MDQQSPATTAGATASTTTPTATDPPPQPQEQQPTPSTSTITPTATPNPTPVTNPNPSTVSKPSQPLRPPSSFSRPWQHQQQQQPPQQQQHFPHFSSATASSPSVTAPRGGIALGVPAGSTQPGGSFSGSFAQHQQFGGLRAGPNVTDSVSSSSPLQAKPQVQGMGMMGSQMQRPGGISVQHHQQRPLQQSSLRPTLSSASTQSPATPNFQGQALMRVSSVSSPSSPSPSTQQNMHNQPWLSSGQQGKPPLPTTSYRPQMNSASLQQRSHIPQPHVSMPAASQQHVSSAQPPPRPSHQLPDQYGQQQYTPPRSITHQLQMARTTSAATPRPPSLATVPSVPSTLVQSLTQSKPARTENEEYCNRILSKRSINELVNQIDPSEKLDAEVEDILVDIAEDFVDSITTFGCSLAKHRKSDVLEAKDILLHLERNWNLTLPGFGGDEIKTYRKPLTNDIHKERLAVIKKSAMATESANTKISAGQAGASTKTNQGKVPSNTIGSS